MKKIVMGTENKTVKNLFDSFVRHCSVKNLSSATIADYRTKVSPFLESYGDFECNTLSQKTVNDYILKLKKEHDINDVSLTSYIRSLRAFLYFGMDDGAVSRFKLVLPKSEKQIKRTYSSEDLEKLLKKPNKRKCDFSEFRNWVFVSYMIGTGNRLSTALNVRIGDIDFQNGFIKLTHTKNRRSQLIPLSDALKDVLVEYLAIRGNDPSDFLFCDANGKQMTTSGAQTAIYRYNKMRGVQLTTIHGLRHSFAKSWVQNGGNVFQLQRLMGHSNLNVTREYVEMFADDLKIGFQDYNPLDRMSKQKHKIGMR